MDVARRAGDAVRHRAAVQQPVERFGGAVADAHGVERDARKRRRGRLADEGVVVRAEDGQAVRHGEARRRAGVDDLARTRVVRAVDGGVGRKTGEPVRKPPPLAREVLRLRAQGTGWIARDVVPGIGQRAFEAPEASARPVRFVGPGLIVPILHGGGGLGADVGKRAEAGLEQRAGGQRAVRRVVVDDAGIPREGRARARKGVLRIDQDGRYLQLREPRGDPGCSQSGDDAFARPVAGEVLVGDAARDEVQCPRRMEAHVVEDARQVVAGDADGRFEENGDARGHGSAV